MSGLELNKLEDEGMNERKRSGMALITVGKVLLWMDFLLLAFVYVGLRNGSLMWLWWVLLEGVLGLVLIEIGSYKRGPLHRD
jgi:hypothetical protein